jgi:poly(hydroxyalkanoate) depolymerase family esterase
MTRYRNHLLTLASVSLGALFAAPAHAASLVKVDRGTWGASGVPDYVTMYIYVPDQLATKPPIVVAHHSCGTAVSGYVNSIKGIQAGADKNGFVLILPEATGRNCWDVGTTKSLTHDGGGDTQAVAQMVKYALTKYSGDASRVYAMGGSSGAMMTQALLAVYPDVFRAGSARAGVAAGCWAAGFDAGQQWSNSCAGGTNTKTAMQWGDGVRAMFPSYTGHRPRLQLFHGDADATINYKNLAESIKEWTNVFGLSATPTSTDMITTPISNYNRQFWKNACGFTVFEAWTAPGKGHSMNYEEDAILKFFGLDTAGGADPETECPPGGGTGGAGGMGGMGGASSGSGGAAGGSAGASTGTAGAGGVPSTGGTGPAAAGSGGLASTAGSNANPGVAGTGAGGPTGAGGTSATGTAGTQGTMPSNPGTPSGTEDPGGCSVGTPSTSSKPAGAVVALAGLALLGLRRRRRSA